MGTGPVVGPRDRVAVYYTSVDYRSGRTQLQTWPPPPLPLVVQLSGREAWEDGIVGMRAGGRRELIIPSGPAIGNGALDYVFDLVRIEPASSKAPAGG